jgi:hypothetical protein
VLLEKGRLIGEGNPQDVGLRYLQLNFSEEAREIERAAAADEASQAAADGKVPASHEPVVMTSPDELVSGEGGAEITEAWFEDEDGVPQFSLASEKTYAFAMRVRFSKDVKDPLFAVSLTNPANQQLFGAASVFSDPHPGTFKAGDEVVWRAWFENILGPDRYQVSCAASLADGRFLQYRERMFSIVSATLRPTGSLVDVPYRLELQRDRRGQEVAS